MKLSIKECFAFGWATFRSRPWIFVIAALFLGAVSLAFNIVTSAVQLGVDTSVEPVAVIIFSLALLIVSIVSIYVGIVLDNMGVTKFYLMAHDNVSSVRVKDLWQPHPFVKYVLTSILFALMFFVGLVLLIVPGIIVGLTFGMALYLVMDRGLGPIEALKESARITKGNRWRLFLLGLAILGANILGAVLLLVGLFVSVPVSMLAAIHAYRTLSQNASAPVAA